MKYLLPWKHDGGWHYRFDIREKNQIYGHAIAYIYRTKYKTYAHCIINTYHHPFCRENHNILEEAISCVDNALFNLGWIFIDDSRAEKLKLLL